jgi:hypothetical protein
MGWSTMYSTAPDPTVYVVATPDGFEAALQRGAVLQADRGAALVVVIPEVPDPHEYFADRAVRRQARISACERATWHIDPTAEVRLCVGASIEDAIERSVPRRSTVVVAGPDRFWFPSRAQRLTEQLRRLGYKSCFVSTSQPGRLAQYMWRRVMAAHGGTLFAPPLRQPGVTADSAPR